MSIRTLILLSALGALSLGVAQQARNMEPKLASDVAASLTKQTGIGIYMESRVAKEKVLWPVTSEPVTAENLQDEILRLVKALPRGADWGKLYLPPPPAGKIWKGDEVLAYAKAQAQLYGKVGVVHEGSVEILSQKVIPEKSKEVIAALNLKPVYIIALERGTFAGVWQTTFGEMHLTVNGTRITGTYTSGGGEIVGVVSGNALTFRWFEVERDQGGSGIFRLADDGESFTGEWCDDGNEGEMASSWTGTRISRR
ncbi:MAG: hypothetical protein M3R13_07465 [Armatimonadota bacterium]|nr:hypothetical protein [Armatimonadota bacterium]